MVTACIAQVWPRAAIYGKLGRRKEAQTAIGRLLTLYPDFPKKARQEYRRYAQACLDLGHVILDHAVAAE